MAKSKDTIIMFDVDGTLTKPRLSAGQDMKDILEELRKKYYIAIVGGSDYEKQKEQLGAEPTEKFDYVFSENGLNSFKDGENIHVASFIKWLGEEKFQKFVNFTLRYIADLEIPVKRGTFIELRNGLLNVSPIGRNCSQSEREAFGDYDAEHKIREKLCKDWEAEFPDYGLKYSIGGQISVDVFPIGWDKTYYKTMEGGNDYEIAHSDKIKEAFTVKDPSDTITILKERFLK